MMPGATSHLWTTMSRITILGQRVRLCRCFVVMDANIVEEYVLLNALLHFFVGLKRTWDLELSSGQMSRQLYLAITGLMLTFMTIHGGLPVPFRGRDISCDLHHTYQLVAKLVDYVGSPSSLWSCVSRFTLETRHVVRIFLKTTCDRKLSSESMCGQLHTAITLLMLLTFMVIHLIQFRFADVVDA